MATTPSVYQGFKPDINVGGLSPLQLAGLNFMLNSSAGTSANAAPFGVNIDFMAAARQFASSEIQTPLNYDVLTGLPKIPDLIRDVVGIAYYVRGDDVYLFRQAQDCGPNENRTEEVWIGKTYDIAKGTYAYYGRRVGNGSYGTGSSAGNYGSGYQSPGGPGVTGPGPAPGTNTDGSSAADGSVGFGSC